ncbi:MAG TPA: aldo/keto reductase [Steroidobacteraceae bacterium]|nr:aldo/keto reductase [Steroidobacteraceae bacterium]
MRSVTLPSGERVPALGIGTWRMGEKRSLRAAELATLRLAIESGATLVDTAELYGEGATETLVGEALAGEREEVFLVTKLHPRNAARKDAVAACERSLLRLRTDRIDLYLLHWRGQVPFAETLEAFLGLQQQGKIRYFGVSNFDTDDMREIWEQPAARAVAVNQVLYNLARRGPEVELLPWLGARRVPLMAYSPFDQGALLERAELVAFADRHGLSPAQVALGWLLSRDDVIAIPKTANRDRLAEDLAAVDHPLTSAQLRELDRLFPRPADPRRLETV